MVNELLDAWQRNLRYSKSLSYNTTEAYFIDMQLFVRFLKEYNEENVTIDTLKGVKNIDWRAWFASRINKGESSKSIARGLSALKSFYRFLIEQGILEDHAIVYSKPPKVSKSLPRPLKVSEVRDISENVETLKQTEWLVKRDRALLMLIYSVGLRISEALNLNIADIKSDFINIIGKGGKIRKVPFLEEVRALIEGYLNDVPFGVTDESPLFISCFNKRLSVSAVQKLVQKSRRQLGLSDTVTPHALRHTCASDLMENSGGDIRSIQELLGHSSITSTQVYTKISKKFLSESYDKFHPKSYKGKK